MATVILPKLLANFTTSLASSISAAATTLTLSTSTDPDGSTLSGLYELTIDEGTNTEEHFYVTMTGSSGSISRRGLSKVDAWTEQTANKFVHNRGASVKITDFSLILISRLLGGTDTFNAVDWLGVNSISGLATPLVGETTKAANVAYVNAVAIAGASDATTTQKGISELATDAELQAGTGTGSVGPLVATGTSFTQTPTANKVPVANSSGKLASGWGGSASTLATLNSSSLVVEDPANATATPTASKIIKADASGLLGPGWAALTTAGDTVYRGAANLTRLGIGTAKQVLKVNSGATAPEWAAQDFGGTGADGALSVPSGTTNIDASTTNLVIKIIHQSMSRLVLLLV